MAGNIVRQTALLWGTEIAGKILQFILVIAIARYLGDVGLGKYAFVFSFVGLFTIVSDFGTGLYMVREVARDNKLAQRFFENIFWFKLLLSVLIIVGSISLILLTSNEPDVRFAVGIAAMHLLFANLSGVVSGIFQAYEKLETVSIINFIERLVLVGIGFFALLNGHGLMMIFVAYLLSTIISFVLFSVFARRVVRFRFRIDIPFIKQSLRYGMPFWLTGVFNLIYFRIDTVMLTYMAGFEVTGWYSASYRALDALYFIPGSVILVLYPVMSRLYVTRKEEVRQLYFRATHFLFLLGLPISIGTMLIADKIIPLLYSTEFTESILVMQIIIWAATLIFVSSITGNLLNAIGKAKLFTLATGIGMVINVVLNLLLIPLYQHIGASVATIITEVIILGLLMYFAYRQDFGIDVRMFFKPIVAGAFMAGSILLSRHLHLLLIVGIAAVVYGTVLFAVKGISRDDIELVKTLFHAK